MEVAVPFEQFDKKYIELLELRKFLKESNTNEAEAERTIIQSRTVDAPTLQLLKSPNYPFSLCDEAPSSYVPPPVPFALEEELTRLRDLVVEVQDGLEMYSKSRRPREHNTNGVASLSASEVVEYLNDSLPFVSLAWGVSSLRWFHRWVLSHSLSGLWKAKEQLEYVLMDDGQPLPSTVEEIEFHTKRCPFPMAVDRLERDRKATILAERRRLNSSSRTYRDRVSSSAIRAATTPFLSPEEKYLYQEIFNETEHRVQTLNFSKMKNRASRASSAGPNPSGHGSTSLVRSSCSFVEPDYTAAAAEALDALEIEKEKISELNAIIRERKQKNIRFDTSESERAASRSAQITVYGCLLSDEQLMVEQDNDCQEFFKEYLEWLNYYGFNSHNDLMQRLSDFCGEVGKWPMEQEKEGSHWSESPGRFGNIGESSNFRPSSRTLEDPFALQQPSSQMPVYSQPHSFDNQGQPQDNLYIQNTHPSGKNPGAESQEILSAADMFFQLLVDFAHFDTSDLPSCAVERLWLLTSLRLATKNLCKRLWSSPTFTTQSHRLEQALQARLSENPYLLTQRGAVNTLMLVLKCLGESLVKPRSTTQEYEIVELDNIGDSFQLANMNAQDIAVWGAYLDALWFQVDPSGETNGGLLGPDADQSSFCFLNLSSACFSGDKLLLFYGRERPPYAVNTLRTVLEKPLSFLVDKKSRFEFTESIFSALQKVERAGVLGFYACRMEEASFVALADILFVYYKTTGRISQCERIGLMPPFAVALKRMSSGLGLSASVYSNPIHFSSIGVQIGDLLALLGSAPSPAIEALYYYGETVKEQAFWDFEQKVVPHAFVGAFSHPSNMEAQERALSIERASMGRGDTVHLSSVPRSRQLTTSVLRQVNYMMRALQNE